jgi:hypothetical protein
VSAIHPWLNFMLVPAITIRIQVRRRSDCPCKNPPAARPPALPV